MLLTLPFSYAKLNQNPDSQMIQLKVSYNVFCGMLTTVFALYKRSLQLLVCGQVQLSLCSFGPDAKTTQGYHKKVKLQINIPYEHIHKKPQQNTSKLNPATFMFI